MNDIADEVLANQPKAREGIGAIMGGQVMTLASDKMAAEARIEGGNNMLYKLVQDGDITIEKGAEKMGVSSDQFLNQMALCGYKVPDCTGA